MYKGSIKALLVTILAVSLVLPFTISSFATGYDFSDMGDRDRETFSGTNDVYTNGIYIGGSGTDFVFDTIMENSNNTYNGTSNIDNTAYPADSYDTGSTYNGTLNVSANDVLPSAGINQVNSATVNANTEVTVNEVLADNSLNAGVQFNSSEFNGDVTLSGSGSVNLAGSTVNNLVLGDIPLMSSLIKAVAIMMDNLTNPIVQTGNSRSFTFEGVSYSYSLRDLRIDSSHLYYCNFSGFLLYLLNNLRYQLSTWYNVSATSESASYTIANWNNLPTIVYRVNFNVYSYSNSTDVISKTIEYRYSTFYTTLYNYLERTVASYIDAHIAYLADTWYRWYNPNISASDSQFWIAFNTDTEVYDHVNLSTVFGYITWYLGQLYIQGNEAAADISQSVDDMATAFTDLESKENQINSSIKSSLNNIDDYFNLPVLSHGYVVIRWLQYMWGSLGMFQGVTIIAWALIILTIVTGFYKVKRITV